MNVKSELNGHWIATNNLTSVVIKGLTRRKASAAGKSETTEDQKPLEDLF